MINMKKFYAGKLLALLALIIVSPTIANNISVSNVSLTGQNVASDYTEVRFDISWENSWRTSSAPNNWDAAWIFVKYRVGSGPWNHATLKSTGHTAPVGSTISAPADNTGVFLYRDVDGSGTFSKTGVKLRWDYAANGVGDNDVVDVKVFAIEMVYVPEGAFYVGSGGTEYAQFYVYPDENVPYLISNEDEIIVGVIAGNLYYSSTNSDQGDQLGPIPAAHPKGTNSFYCMKYEVSQQCYVEFLNILSRDQQNGRTETNLATGVNSVINRYVLSNTSTMTERNGIRCDANIDSSDPITFYCDYNGNGIGGESNDGQTIACNFISWADLMAYLDWAALRPMSEFEFEKICRGPLNPVPNEYAWHTTTAIQCVGITNEGSVNEVSSNGGNVNYRRIEIGPGPMRVGSCANANSTQFSSGASYYGAMDMSGNSWERPVSAGNPIGRSFTGTTGDGMLTSDGAANVENWPGANAVGGSFRGGWWGEYATYMRVSARHFNSHAGIGRIGRMGGRGIRTTE